MLLLHLLALIIVGSAVGRSQAVSILAQLTLLHSGMSPAKQLQLFSCLMHLTLPHPQAVTKAAKPDHQVLGMLHQLLLSQLQTAISAAELRPACLWTQRSAWLTLCIRIGLTCLVIPDRKCSCQTLRQTPCMRLNRRQVKQRLRLTASACQSKGQRPHRATLLALTCRCMYVLCWLVPASMLHCHWLRRWGLHLRMCSLRLSSGLKTGPQQWTNSRRL